MATTEDVYSNPMAPMDAGDSSSFYSSNRDSDFIRPVAPPSQRLTNNDFRRLLLTPRPMSASSNTASSTSAETSAAGGNVAAAPAGGKESEASIRRKKRKAFFAQRAKHQASASAKAAEGAASGEGATAEDGGATPSLALGPYRDRAKERREGKVPVVAEPETLTNSADYRAVAPAAPGSGAASRVSNFAERRRQMIEESKYLGGDMEHTHLVKGLDYSLLEKVRQEIQEKEKEGVEGGDDMDFVNAIERAGREMDAKAKAAQAAVIPQLQSRMARNIYRTLFEKQPPQRNDLFAPGRMAYRVDLSEEWAEFDVPATIIRSKADCPALLEGNWNGGKDGTIGKSVTQERVVSRIIEILSFLRLGRRQAKKLAAAKKAKEEIEAAAGGHPGEKKRQSGNDLPLYDDVGEYRRPEDRRRDRDTRHSGADRRDTHQHRSDRDRDHRGGNDHRERGDRRDQAERNHERDHRVRQKERERERERDHDRDRGDRERPHHVVTADRGAKSDQPSTSKVETHNVSHVLPKAMIITPQDVETEKKKERERVELLRKKMETSGYDECYPGFAESYDAMGDSDDETDYTKMDLGNRKGPVGRWDFDSVEEYSQYMSSREALPKAAFQYGVKMSDGRKTRRPEQGKEDINRQWQQIQALMTNKRKGEGGGAEGGKKPKY